jgi:hypothetical protein
VLAGGVVEVDDVAVVVVTEVLLDVGGLEDGLVEEDARAVDDAGPPVVGLAPVVVSVLVLLETLQPDASAMEAIATPAPVMAARFKNCLLEYLVTRKMAFFPWLSCFSFSVIITLRKNRLISPTVQLQRLQELMITQCPISLAILYFK